MTIDIHHPPTRRVQVIPTKRLDRSLDQPRRHPDTIRRSNKATTTTITGVSRSIDGGARSLLHTNASARVAATPAKSVGGACTLAELGLADPREQIPSSTTGTVS
jgi:hypothetical protein